MTIEGSSSEVAGKIPIRNAMEELAKSIGYKEACLYRTIGKLFVIKLNFS